MLTWVFLPACRYGFEVAPSVDSSDGDTDPCVGRVFSAPSADSIVTDFSAGLPGDWGTNGSCIGANGGELVAVVPTSMPMYCMGGPPPVHFTCSSVTVRVLEVTNQQLGAQTFLYVDKFDGVGRIALLQEGPGYLLGMNGTGVAVDGLYDAARDRWWRIRETGGTFVFETSPDGATWVERVRTETTVDTDNAYITFGAGAYMPLVDPGQARFDCVNTITGCP